MADNCIYVGCDESYEFFTEKLVRGRRPWTCGECGDDIAVGDLHEHFKGMYDGDWEHHRTCARCLNVRKDFFREWMFTHMVEDFQEAHGFDYRDGIPADLTPCGAED